MNADLYFQYMNLPENGTKGYEEHWWYKDNSNVRIIGLNSNGPYQIQEQLDWLDSILTLTEYSSTSLSVQRSCTIPLCISSSNAS